MPRNRRHYQRKRRDAIQREAEREEEITNLFESPGHARRDARKVADLVSCGAVTAERAKGLLEKLVRFGEETKKPRELVTIVSSLSKVARLGLEDEKIQLVRQKDFIPVAPVESRPQVIEEVPADEAEELPIAFFEAGASEEDLVETFQVLMECGVAERMIEQARQVDETPEQA